MRIWIKEIPNILTISKISYCLKKDFPILPLVSYEDITNNDIIIISQMDDSAAILQSHCNCPVLVYEDYIQTVFSNAIREVEQYYDFYYLKNAIAAAKQPSTTSIISGSSYGLFGIDESILSHEVNCSLSSQDLYYSSKLIYDICQANNNIRNIVICCSYYYFFSDLSKTKTPGEITRISNVYQPLFNDLHNCTFLPPKQCVLYNSNIFDIKNVAEIYALGEYSKHYFNEQRPRKQFAMKYEPDTSRSWHELTESQKTEFGESRAKAHNKNLQREFSLAENKQIFEKLAQYCFEKNINLVVVVTPATHYYRSAFDAHFKNIFYDTLNSLEYPVHLLDLFDNVSYVAEDYNDTDHLSDKGATKMTKAVLELLHIINKVSI